ncbi:MAG: copper resistance protein CopC [Candidatus Rokubacteria bacterium]|nr:copper resistance protein CopC [Candidatus Rokubacteria bacterium]
MGLAGALALAGAFPLHAHSLLLDASPAPHATVPAPAEVRLRFNNRVERALSRLAIVDARGTRHELSLARDAAPDRLAAPAPALPPGAYRVEWQVLSADGHSVNGRYPFRIAP